MRSYVVENERKQLLNGLSDAIKECQLRFGGKRELATETDGRVYFLCSKLEQIFLHGLKRKANISTTSVIANTKNTLINLKNTGLFKNPGNLLTQFFDENKPQQNSDTMLNQNEPTFWIFLKNFLNKFDIERFELLTNIKTDVARQRSWIRNCLNEHSLERYTMAILSNENLIKEYYEEWCLLLDKEFNSTLPMLVSGLQSILFAINIDNPNFNMSLKIPLPNKANNQTSNIETEPIKINLRSKSTTSFGGNSLESAETTSIKIKKNNKIRKNNVVVFDIEDDIEDISPGNELSQSVKLTTTEEFLNENDLVRSQSQADYNNLNDSGHDKVGVLTNPIKYNKISPNSVEIKGKNIANNNMSDTSGDSSSEKISETYKYYSSVNLIPLNSSFNTQNATDTLSIHSYQSENSNDLRINGEISPNEMFGNYSSFNRLNEKIKNSNLMNPDTSTNNTENLSLHELREVVLAMIQRKEEIETKNKNLIEVYNEEKIKNKGLTEKVNILEKEAKFVKDNYQSKLQNLEYENNLLKEQLKKYVSAMQMIRSNDEIVNNLENREKIPTIPSLKENMHRDYSFEAEQYEKKLIQVAEMHGELMEFNSRLHKILNYRNSQVEKLKAELIELRGPLSADQMADMNPENLSLDADVISLTNSNVPLINIWIPSVFLRSEKSGSHHVYQVYIQIKNEEWNIYRRFSHFFNLNIKLTEKYPIIGTIPFPKKKAIGNKDSRFVEKRRKLLQDYLRQVLNSILTLDKDLNAKPCRETLMKAVPFLSDQNFEPIPITESNSTRSLSLLTQSGNSLNQIIRHNRTTSSVLLNNQEIITNSPSANAQSELFYTGL